MEIKTLDDVINLIGNGPLIRAVVISGVWLGVDRAIYGYKKLKQLGDTSLKDKIRMALRQVAKEFDPRHDFDRVDFYKTWFSQKLWQYMLHSMPKNLLRGALIGGAVGSALWTFDSTNSDKSFMPYLESTAAAGLLVDNLQVTYRLIFHSIYSFINPHKYAPKQPNLV